VNAYDLVFGHHKLSGWVGLFAFIGPVIRNLGSFPFLDSARLSLPRSYGHLAVLTLHELVR
jgi:hypothetical protein